MPCDASYLDPNDGELNLSRVYCLLQELETGRHVDTNSPEWRGFHPAVYNCYDKRDLDKKVAELCEKLKKIPKRKLSSCSLELQIWWRDHQKADKNRLENKLYFPKNAIERNLP